MSLVPELVYPKGHVAVAAKLRDLLHGVIAVARRVEPAIEGKPGRSICATSDVARYVHYRKRSDEAERLAAAFKLAASPDDAEVIAAEAVRGDAPTADA